MEEEEEGGGVLEVDEPPPPPPPVEGPPADNCCGVLGCRGCDDADAALDRPCDGGGCG